MPRRLSESPPPARVRVVHFEGVPPLEHTLHPAARIDGGGAIYDQAAHRKLFD